MNFSCNFKSQRGEDLWIQRQWDKLGLPATGFYVEFGAGDGVHYSNTFFLEHEHRWNGLLIEADPRTQIVGRNAIIDRRVVGPTGKASFGLHPTDPYLSGLNRPAAERIEVDRVPLSHILWSHRIPHVDLISIDTEGTELEAWRTLNLKEWRPKVAIIELETWQLPDRSAEIIAALTADGYDMIHRTDLNGIFQCRA